jgi:NifU-like protein involved in Fe-S cluster formation
METNDLIVSYSRDPVWQEVMKDYTVMQKVENTICGDFLIVYVKIDANDRIKAFSWSGDPAMHTLAAASLLTEYIVGESVDTVLERSYTQIKERWLTVSTRRQRSAVTALLATRNALHARRDDWLSDTYEWLLMTV